MQILMSVLKELLCVKIYVLIQMVASTVSAQVATNCRITIPPAKVRVNVVVTIIN